MGDLETAQNAVEQMRGCPSMGFAAGEESLAEAWLLVGRGRPQEARAVLAQGAGQARRTAHRTSELLLLTDIARLGGAAEVTDRLAELEGLCDGPFAAARARLAAALAQEDPGALQAVAEKLEALGAFLLAAEAASTAAALWLRTDRTRQATAASHQAQACAARCPGARTPLLTPASSAPVSKTLTKREHQVALLAAAGTTSKDIAEALHLSVRTVDNHLQHVYAKLGITHRGHLARSLGALPPASKPARGARGPRGSRG
jgi:DNA-binding CsgD family transcriptional regulator